MSSTEARYEKAIAYTKRAIDAVENDRSSLFSVFGSIDAYAGRLKTATARSDLRGIEARWLRAATDKERASVAREAELLADRTEENLPGAPQDWARTNLTPDEKPTSNPATSLSGEIHKQAAATWNRAKKAGEEIASGGKTVAKLLLVGGAVFLGIEIARAVGSDRGGRE